jgi:photosystem II stability/assembly factor-like uncharacterized protein
MKLGVWIGTALAIVLTLWAPGPVHAGLNQWTTNGPAAVSIRAVATDPLNVGPVYAASEGFGMFKSLDGGASWTSINSGLTSAVVRAVAINPQVSSTLYIGTAGGVFASTNGGATWTLASSGLGNLNVSALVVDPQTPTIVYAGTAAGVFKSTNAGLSWSPANVGVVGFAIVALAIDPQTPSTLYAGTTGGGAFKSTNGAASWFTVNTGLTNFSVAALAVDPQAPSTLYAGTAGGGVFKSSNGAFSWVPANSGLTFSIAALAIDPQNSSTLYAGTAGTGVFQSVNGGSSWAPFNVGLSDTVVNALAVTLFGTCVHAGTASSGVFDLGTASGSCGPSPLAAAVLPASRSVQVGKPASAFATIINSGPSVATGCQITAPAGLGAFLYQTTDSANQLTGTPNTPVAINPSGTNQTFFIAFTPSSAFAPTEVFLTFGCANTASAPGISGVNTLVLSASSTAVPDIVALAATTTQDGIVNIQGVNGAGAFAVSAVNVGASGLITATATTGVAALPVTITICETDAAANCKSSPAASVTRTINSGETPTYSVFVAGTGTVGFNPSLNRIFVSFTDGIGTLRGSTSVAARTQ